MLIYFFIIPKYIMHFIPTNTHTIFTYFTLHMCIILSMVFYTSHFDLIFSYPNDYYHESSSISYECPYLIKTLISFFYRFHQQKDV